MCTKRAGGPYLQAHVKSGTVLTTSVLAPHRHIELTPALQDIHVRYTGLLTKVQVPNVLCQ